MSDERKTFDIDDMHEAYTEKSVMDEAARQATIPNGKYKIEIKAAKGYFTPDDSPTPGRRMIDFQVAVHTADKVLTKFVRTSFEAYRVTESAGKRLVISPEHELYDASLALDAASKRWAQMVTVVDPQAQLSVSEQAKALLDSTMGTYVMEGFRDDNDGMHFYKTEEERKALVKAGFAPTNFFTSFFAWRDQ